VGCDDGNKCTDGDGCVNGTCVGKTTVCDDGNACTDDSCNPISGCVFAPISCPNGGVCKNGKCAGCAPDEYEPDKSVETATLIGIGETQTHSICPTGDIDYIKMTLDKSAIVKIFVQGQNVDLSLGIYDSTGQMASVDAKGIGGAEIYDVQLQPDWYYIVISQVDTGEGGTYTITASSSCSPQCDGKKCGDDGCGGSCGTCDEHYSCNNYGNCVWHPYCGDFDCRENEGENCESCPADCKCDADASCIAGTCLAVAAPVEPTPDPAIEEADVIDTSGSVSDDGSNPAQVTSGEASSGCAASAPVPLPVPFVLMLLVLVAIRMRWKRH